MSQDNHITLRGYLTAEPTLHQKTAAATPVTEIRVGCTPRRLNRETGEWYDAPTSYYRVKCWRRLAINAALFPRGIDVVLVHDDCIVAIPRTTRLAAKAAKGG